MPTISRRSMVKTLVVLGAFVRAARALAREPVVHHAALAGQPRTPPRPDPTLPPPPPRTTMIFEKYAAGPAVSVSSDRLVIETRDRGKAVLHLSATTEVWEGLWVQDIPAKIGDRITAWGPRRPDGSHDVEQLWVNLVNLRGIVTKSRQEADTLLFSLRSAHHGTRPVRVDQRARHHGTGLRDNQRTQVVGRKLKDGSVEAVTVFFD